MRNGITRIVCRSSLNVRTAVKNNRLLDLVLLAVTERGALLQTYLNCFYKIIKREINSKLSHFLRFLSFIKYLFKGRADLFSHKAIAEIIRVRAVNGTFRSVFRKTFKTVQNIHVVIT